MLQRSTDPIPHPDISHRDQRLLRAVADGRVQRSGGVEPDYFVDGIPCCDHVAARALARAGLIHAERPAPGHRVAVLLTSAGADALASTVALAAD